MFKTMAIQINENTYPIAVACLSSSFARQPMSTVMNCYLVINELGVKSSLPFTGAKDFTLSNTFYTPDDFNDRYEIVDENSLVSAAFAEVRHI